MSIPTTIYQPLITGDRVRLKVFRPGEEGVVVETVRLGDLGKGTDIYGIRLDNNPNNITDMLLRELERLPTAVSGAT